MFEGITGSNYESDIAIDDFVLKLGSCPPSEYIKALNTSIHTAAFTTGLNICKELIVA